MTDRLGDDLLPTEEELGVGRLESCESLVWAHIRCTHRLNGSRQASFQRGVLGRIAAEPLQSRPGSIELTDQHLAGAREALERLGLAPGSVQGKHQLTPAPLAQRLLSNHGLEVGNQLTCLTVGESGIHEILGCGASGSSAAHPLRLRSSCSDSPGTRRRATDRARVRAGFEASSSASRQESVPLLGELLEPDRVDLRDRRRGAHTHRLERR
jgi:hypothetical protein